MDPAGNKAATRPTMHSDATIWRVISQIDSDYYRDKEGRAAGIDPAAYREKRLLRTWELDPVSRANFAHGDVFVSYCLAANALGRAR